MFTSITISNGVTCIKDFSFEGCTELKSVTIPDNVTSIGMDAFSAFTVFHTRGFTFSLIDSEYVGCYEQLSMILERNYAAKIDDEVKYPLLWRLYVSNPNDSCLFFYIKANFDRMFPFAIKGNNVSAVSIVCESGKFLTTKNIDSFIETAIENTQNGGGNPEIQVILTNYKYEKLGFKKDAFSSFKL